MSSRRSDQRKRFFARGVAVLFLRHRRAAGVAFRGMRGAFLLLALAALRTHASDLRVPANSGQAVFVTSENWHAPDAQLQRWERDGQAGRWAKTGAPMAVRVGERGMAWGLGLHDAPRGDAPRKVEGDRRAPAGIFQITGAFGRGAKGEGRMPWKRITPDLEAIDDPDSRFYNRLVDRAQVVAPDWRSSERMAQIPDYALGLIVAHNPRHRPGAGSCIFLHLWQGKRRGTAGCTILRERDLVALLRWLDPARNPVLIQLPREVAERALSGF